MPTKKTTQRARKAARQGKAPTTQAGEFVREEMEHVREGRHGASSRKQAIAIGLSKARRAGVKVGPPKKKKAGGGTRGKATRSTAGRKRSSKTTARRSSSRSSSRSRR